EFVAAQDATDPGVLVLSRFAGASAELKSALLVNPYDPEAVGAAIARALKMPLEERRDRHAAAHATLLANDINQWGDKFITALTARARASVLAWREHGVAPAAGGAGSADAGAAAKGDLRPARGSLQ